MVKGWIRNASLRRRARTLLRLLLWGVAGFAGLSVLLVLVLRWLPPPASSLMVQRHATALAAGGEAAIHYRWTPLADIAPAMALAAVAAEDQKFSRHRGFDLQAIHEALKHNAQGRRLRGASTITQQVAKNLFLWPGRSYLRKGLEAWFTLLIEALWPKQRILEVYLNIVELGGRLFGVEAASRRYFGKPASQLTRAEAALLAAVLPNPHRYRADAPSAYVRRRQDWILTQMRQLGGSAYLETL
ncbi:MAG: monofunctional biosynthetic peptidoglycan transglycosylase [Pseudomonadota bacterium]|nr:monofunctional biosynthetic peptidoglycan transglycosylase [Pseudomonadota bacterium]